MALRKLGTIFVELEKTYNCVPKEVIRWALKRKSVMKREVLAITEMYRNIKVVGMAKIDH